MSLVIQKMRGRALVDFSACGVYCTGSFPAIQALRGLSGAGGGKRTMAELIAVQGDITSLHVDAIVNAANSSLLGGGGVDGAIHRAAGPELLIECRKLGGCATGAAKSTPGFRLPAKWVFHAVGPVWQGGGAKEDELLAGCYRRCLELAKQHQVRTIAFPAISTGVYRFPPERAARIAISTVGKYVESSGVKVVQFVCFGQEMLSIYERLLAEPSQGSVA